MWKRGSTSAPALPSGGFLLSRNGWRPHSNKLIFLRAGKGQISDAYQEIKQGKPRGDIQ